MSTHLEYFKNSPIIMSASVMCLSQLNLESIIQGIIKLGVNRLHIDLIDQTFGSPGLPVQLIGDIRRTFDIPIDVHIMLDKPMDVVPELIAEGADAICIHQNALSKADQSTIELIHDQGVEFGLVVNPGELPNDKLINKLRPKRLTAMTVQPGGAGRPFEKDKLETIIKCREYVGCSSVEIVEADGAVGPKTIQDIWLAGATQVVIGSTVFPFRTLARNRINELLNILPIEGNQKYA